MKISLNIGHLSPEGGDVEEQALERVILGAKAGDFQARDALFQHYMPLLQSLAKKRADDVSEVNQLIDAGKRGLLNAAQKYKTGLGPARFRLLAVDQIDRAMSDATQGGFFARLFKRK